MEQLSESEIEFLKSNGVDKVVDLDSEEGQNVIREYLYAMGVHTTHPITQFDGERISIKIPIYGRTDDADVEENVVVSTPTPQSVQNIQNIKSIEKTEGGHVMTFSTDPDPGNFFELPVVEQDKATAANLDYVVPEKIIDLLVELHQANPPAEFTRRLATVQKIRDLQPIPGADAIEVATVLGWNVVVKKGEFNVGDYCVYCEIDSVLDTNIPEFAFLEKVKGRIKTIRLRGQISQGIAFPLSILPSIVPECVEGLSSIEDMENIEGMDVTEWLGVKKYEPFQNEPKHNPGMRGARTVTRPYFVPKTDEPRIQSVPDFLERHAGTTMYATEKIDGSSMSVYFRRNPEMELGEFGVCSRNLDIKDPETPGNNYWDMFHRLNLGHKLQNQNRFDSIVIQGELCGPSIQGNKLKFTEHKFFVFNIFFPAELRYANKDEFLDIVDFFELTPVPVVLENFPLTQTIPELIDLATRKSVYNDQVWAEGLVFRPETEIRDPKHGRFSFKAINPEFLLKFNE